MIHFKWKVSSVNIDFKTNKDSKSFSKVVVQNKINKCRRVEAEVGGWRGPYPEVWRPQDPKDEVWFPVLKVDLDLFSFLRSSYVGPVSYLLHRTNNQRFSGREQSVQAEHVQTWSSCTDRKIEDCGDCPGCQYLLEHMHCLKLNQSMYTVFQKQTDTIKSPTVSCLVFGIKILYKRVIG